MQGERCRGGQSTVAFRPRALPLTMAPTATTASGAPQSTRNLDPFHACATCGHEQWTSPPSSDVATKQTLPAGLPTVDAAAWGQLTQLAAKLTKALDGDMRTLSLAIHDRPELKFQERYVGRRSATGAC